MKIASGIYQVGGAGLSAPGDAAVYLVTSGREAALVDAGTGEGTSQILAHVRDAGADPRSIRYLFITHCHYDHIGGAAAIRAASGCSLVAHELDAAYIESGDPEVTAASWYGAWIDPVMVDVKVAGKSENFTVGETVVTLYHAPGHSPGSVVYTMVSDGMTVLFGQDVHGPLNATLRSVREDYIRSLEFMLSLEADILCEGHFGVYVGKEKVRDFIESFL